MASDNFWEVVDCSDIDMDVWARFSRERKLSVLRSLLSRGRSAKDAIDACVKLFDIRPEVTFELATVHCRDVQMWRDIPLPSAADVGTVVGMLKNGCSAEMAAIVMRRMVDRAIGDGKFGDSDGDKPALSVKAILDDEELKESEAYIPIVRGLPWALIFAFLFSRSHLWAAKDVKDGCEHVAAATALPAGDAARILKTAASVLHAGQRGMERFDFKGWLCADALSRALETTVEDIEAAVLELRRWDPTDSEEEEGEGEGPPLPSQEGAAPRSRSADPSRADDATPSRKRARTGVVTVGDSEDE